MRWIKRLLLLMAIGVVLLVLAAGYSYRLARGVPVWYQPRLLTPDQEHAAANQADQDLLALLSYAADVTAAQRRAYHHPSEPDSRPAAKTITISEDEANAFFDALSGETAPTQNSAAFVPPDAGKTLGKYIADPRLAISGDQLIFAATLKRGGALEGTVVSVAIVPTIDDSGKLNLKIDQVYAGRLPIPQSAFGELQDQLTQGLTEKLESVQGKAQYYKDGTSNRAAAAAALLKMALDSLGGQASDPYIFLPVEMGSTKVMVPLKITAIELQDGSLTFTLEPVSAGEVGG